MNLPRIGEIDATCDVKDVLLWCDNKAENLTKLLELKQEWYQKHVIDFCYDWHKTVFNIDSASIFGVAVWARILGIELTLNLDQGDGQPTFGFDIDEDYYPFTNYDHGNFTRTSGFNVGLNLDLARLLVKLRYLKLITRPSVPYVNRMLNIAFGKGQVYVLDGLNMNYATYVFGYEPGQMVRLIVDYFDLLPRPSCVGVRIIVDREGVFGFSKTNENFKHANYITEYSDRNNRGR